MANENITTYLQENKEKYSVEVLAGKLRSAGYPEDQIQEGVRLVYGGGASGVAPTGAKTSFWDFRSIRVYRSGGEKIIDALFGFFVVGTLAPLPIFLIFRGFVGFPIMMLFYIGFVIYLWRRRKFMALGVLALFALPLLAGLFLGPYIFGSRFGPLDFWW